MCQAVIAISFCVTAETKTNVPPEHFLKEKDKKTESKIAKEDGVQREKEKCMRNDLETVVVT